MHQHKKKKKVQDEIPHLNEELSQSAMLQSYYKFPVLPEHLGELHYTFRDCLITFLSHTGNLLRTKPALQLTVQFFQNKKCQPAQLQIQLNSQYYPKSQLGSMKTNFGFQIICLHQAEQKSNVSTQQQPLLGYIYTYVQQHRHISKSVLLSFPKHSLFQLTYIY